MKTMSYSDLADWQWSRVFVAFALATIVVVAFQFAEIRFGLNIWDEGFLWYGVQRIWAGEVPIRDFMAYDPARYYWVAWLTSLWGGRGILDIRVAVLVFQIAGLGFGLLLLQNNTNRRDPVLLIIASVVLCSWMFPRHKLFDIAISMFTTALLAWWIEKPNARRSLLLGCCTGVIACFGRNHGVYAVAATVLAFAWTWVASGRAPRVAHLCAWVAGIAAGFLPIIFACLFIEGFAGAFWRSILFLIDLKGTNLPLPIPWPWSGPFSVDTWGNLRQVFIGFCFAGLIAYPVVAGFYLWRQLRQRIRVNVAVVATVCTAVPYAHYAFSRADVGHLAQGIFPMLMGLFLLLSSGRRILCWTSGVFVLMATACVTLPSHPRFRCMQSGDCETRVVDGQRLVLDSPTFSDVDLINRMVSRYAPDGRAFVATPYWPGAYAMEQRRSPLWEIYATTGRNDSFQQEEVERLKAANPGFAIVLDFPLDSREELRYSKTHPLTLAYIEAHFERLPSSNPYYLVFKAKD
ncbi:hypothetical protein VC273_13710 [Xanthomonas nasturtii]|uniref:hypothetical protein n=1 Tax=Xanthomonas TaxID=338 RepID=UPI00128FEF24|nr:MULTISPECIES: hypothetical protein [Xanthomonas]MEA9556926.1 hypothetical protein [Xanthomonas nasturtii]